MIRLRDVDTPSGAVSRQRLLHRRLAVRRDDSAEFSRLRRRRRREFLREVHLRAGPSTDTRVYMLST